MYNSTIKRKLCKCGECKKMPSIGFDGYYFSHAPQEIKDRQGVKAKKGYQNKLTKARIRSLSKKVTILAKENNAFKTPEISLQDKWYEMIRNDMINVCCECGGSTGKFNDKFYKWGIAHIVPKGLVDSVKTHEHNWIELCRIHHQEFDNTFDRAAAMKCFGEVKQKFKLFKHLIPNEEMRKINPHLLK
jgi:hypothetical protein